MALDKLYHGVCDSCGTEQLVWANVCRKCHEEENVRRLDRLATKTSPWLEKAKAKIVHKAS